MNDGGDYITAEEIARRVGVCEKTVYGRLLQPGSGLPYHQIGRRKIVGRRAFDAWLNGEVAGREVRGMRQAGPSL